MDKQTLTRSLRQSAGGASFLNKTQVAHFMGMKSKDAVNALLDGVEFYKQGKNHYYLVNDIADRILERRQA